MATKPPVTPPEESAGPPPFAAEWCWTDAHFTEADRPAAAADQTRPVPRAIAEALAGKLLALVGLADADAHWMKRALEQTGALTFVLDAGDSVAVPANGTLFDLVIIDARLDWDAEASGMPVLFVGTAAAIVRWTRTFRDGSNDFVILPCDVEEFLLRASRLASGTP